MHDDAEFPLIRRAEVADAQCLAHLGAATFTETFGHLYPPEDLQNFLQSAHCVANWRKALEDSNVAVWLVNADREKSIGFIAVGKCKLPVQNLEATAGEVQQLYVLGQYHNAKLGTRLMEIGLAWLDSQGRNPVYVGVWSENYGAQRFYARYGFDKVGEYGFRVGSTIDREFILKR
jgi:ribosomal protein S18 acetylase RimI-like enzyme